MLDLSLNVLKFSGSGIKGTLLGNAETSQYLDLKFSDRDPSGNLYIIDHDESTGARLLKINTNGVPGELIDFRDRTDRKYAVGVAMMRAQGEAAIKNARAL